MSKKDTLPTTYFDNLYAGDADPWSFETSAYEEQKYAATIAALPHERYESALEIGCSIGVLTHKLAGHCMKLLAIEPSAAALNRARERLKDSRHVEFREAGIPDGFPAGDYALVLMSEVGYYLSMDDLERTKKLIEQNIRDDGNLVLVHWTHPVDDYPLSGDTVHDLFTEDTLNWQSRAHQRTADYRLDVLERKAL